MCLSAEAAENISASSTESVLSPNGRIFKDKPRIVSFMYLSCRLCCQVSAVHVYRPGQSRLFASAHSVLAERRQRPEPKTTVSVDSFNKNIVASPLSGRRKTTCALVGAGQPDTIPSEPAGPLRKPTLLAVGLVKPKTSRSRFASSPSYLRTTSFLCVPGHSVKDALFEIRRNFGYWRRLGPFRRQKPVLTRCPPTPISWR